jgi:hypothetical protein
VPALRPALVRALLALSESGCELVLASPGRSADAARALVAERLLPALADADRYRFMAFQRALRRALAAQYTAAHGGTPGAADAYAEAWLATSPAEADLRYARAVLHLTAVLGREHTLPPRPPAPAAAAAGAAAQPPPRVVRLDLLPRPLAQVLVVDAAAGATARAYARHALVLPPADAAAASAASNGDGGDGDPLLALADLVALLSRS